MKLSLYLIAITMVIGINGCANNYYDMHEGDSETGSILQSSKTIVIHTINGRRTPSLLAGPIRSYELAAGHQELIASYEDFIYSTPEDFDKVTSVPVKLSFTTEKGKTYQLSHVKIEEISKAKAFAKQPEIVVIDESTGRNIAIDIDYDIDYDPFKEAIMSMNIRPDADSESEIIRQSQTTANTNAGQNSKSITMSDTTLNSVQEPKSASIAEPVDIGSHPSPDANDQEDSSALKILKYSWQQASDKDQQEFLRWIKQ
jgi:uncharacterized protein YccT (UPF0319 family)